jgi:uncharacterized membrane protein YfcA
VSVVTLVLSFSAILTSILSATVGMAGGTVLLSILLFCFIPSTAIPLHAVNQLVANAQRSWLLRKHVNRHYLTAFCGGALIGNFTSAWLLKETITFTHAPLLIAIVIGYSLLKPQKRFNLRPQRRGFFVAGVVLGFIGMFVGATGLILASLFVREDMAKEEIMATQGAIQSFSHGLKVLGFLWIGFDFIPWLLPLALMSLATILGTRLGVAVFRRMPASLFRVIYRSVLALSGVYLVVKWALSL